MELFYCELTLLAITLFKNFRVYVPYALSSGKSIILLVGGNLLPFCRTEVQPA